MKTNTNFFSDEYLQHHGVKGQQWGVRNGPPYPIEDKVLRAGTKLNSVSSQYISSDQYRKNGRWMYTFNPDDKWDASVYRGPFSMFLVQYRGATFVKEHQFEVVKDLKMPTKKERIDEFETLLNDKKYSKIVRKELGDIQKELVFLGVLDSNGKTYGDLDLDNITSRNDLLRSYELFGHAMEATYSQVSTQEYAKRMSKKYDAMVDDNNQGVYNDAHDPVIIFRANEALRDIADYTSTDRMSKQYLSVDDIMNNTKDVETELSKIGKRIKL